ncbi:hypothetical protein [Streptomyces sp. R17]|uniref:Uncharacterized protein n=1 Tax=Streptomyces sp. R17 TaxID=3238626 RepID=A0AB39NWJ7_9ACTN
MVHTESEKYTLRDDQIRVSETAISAADVLRSSMPYLETAIRAIESGRDEHIEVSPEVFRDLVAILAAEVKRADAYTSIETHLLSQKKPRDKDWNPFKGIDISWL